MLLINFLNLHILLSINLPLSHITGTAPKRVKRVRGHGSGVGWELSGGVEGGMQNLMEGLSNALLNHGPVKVIAEAQNEAEIYDPQQAHAHRNPQRLVGSYSHRCK